MSRARVKVRDIMTKQVFTVGADDPRECASALMTQKGVGGLPVLNGSGRILGIVTRRDMRGPARGPLVCDHMTSPAQVVGSRQEARAAARYMAFQQLKRMPVVRDEELVGIVSTRDIVRLFAVPDSDMERTIRRYLDACGYVAPEARIKVSVADGVVSLSGRVLYESDVSLVGALTVAVDGVVDVVNQTHFRLPDPGRRPVSDVSSARDGLGADHQRRQQS